MPPSDQGKIILAYLHENGLPIEEQQEVLRLAQRILEHQEVQKALNKPNKQIAIIFEG